MLIEMSDDGQSDAKLSALETQLQNAFEEAKAVSDFIVIVTTQVGVSALFWVLLDHAKASSYAAKPTFALVIVGLLALYLMFRVGRIVELFVHVTVRRVSQHWPSTTVFRHAALRGFGKAALICIPAAVVGGLGYAAAELVKQQIGN
jgi:hypothetical protein